MLQNYGLPLRSEKRYRMFLLMASVISIYIRLKRFVLGVESLSNIRCGFLFTTGDNANRKVQSRVLQAPNANPSNSYWIWKKRGRSTIIHWLKQESVIMGSLDKSLGAEVVTIDVKATKGLLESGYIYLDVRTVEEYNKGHVQAEKIFNIPYMLSTPEGRVKNPDFLKEVSSVFKEEDHILVGCQSGVRSLYATSDLLTAGFKDVTNVGGGYLAWVENVFPVKTEKENAIPVKIEKERQKAEL